MNKKVLYGLILILIGIGIYFAFVKKDTIFKNEKTKEDIVIKYNEKEYEEVSDDSIVFIQKNVEKELKEEIKKDAINVTIDKPKVILDPYGESPLTALISFKTNKSTKIKMTLKGKNDNDIVQEFDSSKDHMIPVYGLYANYDNKVILIDDDNNKYEVTIKTKDLVKDYHFNDSTLKMDIDEKNNKDNNKFYFVTAPLNKMSLAYDAYGEIRWIVFNKYKEIEMLDNGHILLSSEPLENSEAYYTDLIEIDLFGKIYNYYRFENGYHNDYDILPNGNLLVVSNTKYISDSGDQILEVKPTTGELIRRIDVRKLLDQIDKDYMSKYGDNWDFNSGIYYDKENKSIILSYWHHGTVISINYETMKINWMFGNPDVWSSKFKDYFLRLDGSSEYNYPKSIQAAKVTNGNNLSLFDNDFNYYGSELCSDNKNNISSIIDYTIDYKNKTISLKSRRLNDLNIYSYALGDYDKDDSDLVLFGRIADNMNYNDSSCNLYDHEEWHSEIVEIDNDKILFKAKLGVGTYRVSKLELYKSSKNFDFTPGKTLKSDGKVYASEKINDLNKKIKESIVDETDNYIISIINNKVYANIFLPKDEYANILLVDQYGEGIEYAYKIKGLEDNEILVLNGLSGRYYVYLDLNGTIYDLKQYIDL